MISLSIKENGKYDGMVIRCNMLLLYLKSVSRAKPKHNYYKFCDLKFFINFN